MNSTKLERSCWESQLKDYARRATTRKKTKPSVPWGSFAATAGAALSVNSAAQAEVVHFMPPSAIRVELPTNPGMSTYASTAVDVDGDGNGDLFLGVAAISSSSTLGTPGGDASNVKFTIRAAFGSSYYNDARFLGSGTSIAKLQPGELISAGGPQTSTGFGFLRIRTRIEYGSLSASTFTYGDFNANETGVAGFKFPTGGNDHFGWIRVLVEQNTDGINALEIHDWAYENVPGASIRAGEIPEPSTVGLGALALGAAGVNALRRRPRKK